jgi:hypothetical protein
MSYGEFVAKETLDIAGSWTMEATVADVYTLLEKPLL